MANMGNLIVTGVGRFANNVYSSGYVKNGSSNSYALLGGGGHMQIVQQGTTGSTLVQRTSSGYIFASYFNASCSAETPTTSSYIIYANSDGYFRKSTLANIKSILGEMNSATKAKVVYDVDSSSWGNTIGIGYDGAGLTVNEATHVACFTSKAMTQTGAGTRHIKDMSFANLKTKLGLDYSTLFSGTAAASVGTGTITGYTRLVIFCKNTSNSTYFTVQLQCVEGYHYHIMSTTPSPGGAQTTNKFFGLMFNVQTSNISVSAGKYSTLSSSAALETGPTVHITKVIGYKF